MPITTITIATEGVGVSGLAWRQTHTPYIGRVEAILDANPGLAGMGVEIPVGTVVRLPSVADDAAAPVVERVDLWT